MVWNFFHPPTRDLPSSAQTWIVAFRPIRKDFGPRLVVIVVNVHRKSHRLGRSKNCLKWFIRAVGRQRFTYDDPWQLWAELLPEYQSRLAAISRRNDALSLGDYTLGEFKKFYAALLTVCATQEHLCFAWGRNTGS